MEGLERAMTLYYFGMEGGERSVRGSMHTTVNSFLPLLSVACHLSDDSQSFICNWKIVDGVNYTVSEDGRDEMAGGYGGRLCSSCQ